MSTAPPASTTIPVVTEIAELRRSIGALRDAGRRIGLVPTMGALHTGHLSLIDAAREEFDDVVVTIFVNPTQFGPNEDYRRYPRPIEDDLRACENMGVSLVFAPESETMYPAGFDTHVEVEGLSSILEGAHRPGHFRGVATVVLKLLLATQPDAAYFGRKDYQQQLIVRRMCHDLNVPVEIRTCPTIRDEDGLAVSSRNAYLSPAERVSALSLSRSLRMAEEQLRAGETDMTKIHESMRELLESHSDVTIDYATIADPETLAELDSPQPDMIALVAARVGTTRLIDNLPIQLVTS